jgi:uncharacterized protein
MFQKRCRDFLLVGKNFTIELKKARRMLRAFLIFLFFLNAGVSFCQQDKNNTESKSKPFVLGVIEEIQSAELGEKRILNIYVPEGYDPKDTVNYPVVYLLDGSADEDFIHIVGLYQFNSFSWIGRIPKSIIVGIASVDRRRDYTFPTSVKEDQEKFPGSGKSEKFMNFLEKELQPYIQSKYKTTSSKTIIGESLGGLLATEILFKRPDLFSKYIIVSPSLWWDDGSLLKISPQLSKNNIAQKKEVYIGVGKEGLSPGGNPHVMEVDANILADKIKASDKNNTVVHFDYLPEENHATIMHQAVFNALLLMNKNKSQ